MATRSLGHKAPRETMEDARKGDAEKGGTPGELGDSGAWWAERKHAENTEPASPLAGRTEKARRSCEGRERQSVRADGGEKLPYAHLSTTCPRGQRPGWPKVVRATSVAVPGRGSQSDGAKLKAAVGSSRPAALVAGAHPQAWEARLRNNRR